MGKNLPRVNHCLSQNLIVGLLTLLSGVNSQWSIASSFPQKVIHLTSAQIPDKPASSCPADVKTLTDLLLKDIPSYANRVMQRARQIDKNISFGYVLVAGRPEFEPLPLRNSQSQYSSSFPDATEQIFFTTLERRYSNNKVVQMQVYHWLFLAPTDKGWQLVTVFTRIGSTVPGKPPLPPRETSDGIIGQAVSLWLKDCQTGTAKL